jgi:hypothetical protein
MNVSDNNTRFNIKLSLDADGVHDITGVIAARRPGQTCSHKKALHTPRLAEEIGA